MLEVILRVGVELSILIAVEIINRRFLKAKGPPRMTVRGLGNAAPNANQTIDFGSLAEENNCVAVASTDVRIVSSTGDHVTGSSKVRMNNVVDYTWEEKFYSGQLLAVHMSGKFIAYGIIARNQPQSVVRVVNQETAQRSLIKGIEGNIEDLAFAFMAERVILASLSSAGTLMVHDIVEYRTGTISCQLLMTATLDGPANSKSLKRVFWCPYIPDDLESKVDDCDDGYLLAVIRDCKVELWNVGTVVKHYGSGPHKPKSITEGYLEIDASTSVMSDAAFSPDGSAIATSSYDGRCRFYQVYMAGEGEPRLLHEWEPHDGDPVNTLFFLDNHINPPPDVQFWKYAVTGAKDNCEIKLWSCETWECLQKISLTTKSSRHSRGWGKLKAAIDLSAGYILLSDMYLRLLYVLELKKDGSSIQPYVQTITEFKLPCPILSFGIADAGLKNFSKNSNFEMEDACNGDNEDETQNAVFVRMYLVQPKSLQECTIVFQTNNAIEVHHNANFNVPIPAVHEVVELKKELTQDSEQPAPILMTPDAFHSPHQTPAVKEAQSSTKTPSPPATTPPRPAPEPEQLPRPLDAMISQAEPPFATAKPTGIVSGGSSPSREVEEILSSPCLYPKPTSTSCLQEIALPDPSNAKIETLESCILSLKSDVTGLMELAASQALELKNLREEMRRTEAAKLNEAVDLAVSKAMTAVLANQQQAKICCSIDQEALTEKITSVLYQDLSQSLQRSVKSTILNQYKDSLKPTMVKAVDEMKEMIHNEVSHKLNLTEQALKENLGKVLRSKAVMDNLSHTLSVTAPVVLEEVFKENFVKIGVPIFEKASNAMFQQINNTFTDGLKECKKELESYALKANERANLEIGALQKAAGNLGMVSKSFSAAVDRDTKKLDEAVAETIRNLNKMSMNNGNIRSGAVTPAGHLVDSQVLQAQITQLITHGQVNSAFEQALSASDLNLVLYVCEKVGPQQVFGGSNGCLLQQHVLLSLIQQLSADMTHHTETKQKYLEEAIMCMDPKNSDTKEYMPVVLSALSKQLQLYITSNLNGRWTRRAKMLQMAANSLLSQQ
ncbi:Enhancer of mRNA-decapping protein [Nesidiocoris tenuis]|uniref:Enhancer of mRNA-decapping protein n=1 Tax=Nesidiocoris tenuis TaxID=355587 RepID=A0ABN7A8L6_9HEMI|nr:Enhancer of mRNA-decapping protein [Nesidiocoris tenuis]